MVASKKMFTFAARYLMVFNFLLVFEMSNKGKVKFFNTEKGFGFITVDGGSQDVFVHISALNGLTITENDSVMFDIENGKKGLNAVNVKKA